MAVEQLQEFTNNATTTVPSTISNVATSITVATGTGSLFPTLTGSEFFIATLVNTIALDPGFGQMEIIKVTARSGDDMTVVRGQEGTSGTNFPAGVLFELRPTAQAFNNIYTEILELETTKAPLASPVFTGNPTAPTPTLGDDDTSLATTGFVRDAFEAYGDRHVNMIINPHGSIQQETTTPVTTGSYFADQWVGFTAGSGFAFQLGVTTGTISAYDPSHLFSKTTTAKGSLAAGDAVGFTNPIEGNYIRRLLMGTSNAKGSWLRWRASSSQAGTASVAVRNGAQNRSFVQSFAVTTTPTDYSLFVPGDTTGTWSTDTTIGATIAFTHAAGTTFQTATLGEWQAGNVFAANTQSNMLDTVNRQLNITDVQWNDAPILLPFVTIDYQQELARCQRYFESLAVNGRNVYNQSSTAAMMDVHYQVTKRTLASLVYTGAMPTAENTNTPTAVVIDRNRTDGVQLSWTGAGGPAGATAGRMLGGGTMNFNSRM